MTITDASGKILFESTGNRWLDIPFDEISLAGAQMEGIDFSGAYMEDAVLAGANLKHADLYWCIARRADFSRADLSHVCLCGSDCQGASFLEANLDGTDFRIGNLGSQTNLCGADLRTPSLASANLKGAQFDSSTLFPDGFDPAVHGMELVDSVPGESGSFSYL